ncbi:MAG TPA: hypothetical protein VFA60_15395 [Terriglobales bacterium]|nr:hypothetical protein [Terriglobales bacterium]
MSGREASNLHPNSTAAKAASEEDEKLGVEHENLEGWIPALATEDEVRVALEKAFDYRGDLVITLKDGTKIEGYVFDRRADSPALADCIARVIPKNERAKVNVRYSDIAALAFGKDTAAGKSFEAWVKKYKEKKAAGEKNIGLHPEPLD